MYEIIICLFFLSVTQFCAHIFIIVSKFHFTPEGRAKAAEGGPEASMEKLFKTRIYQKTKFKVPYKVSTLVTATPWNICLPLSTLTLYILLLNAILLARKFPEPNLFSQ